MAEGGLIGAPKTPQKPQVTQRVPITSSSRWWKGNSQLSSLGGLWWCDAREQVYGVACSQHARWDALAREPPRGSGMYLISLQGKRGRAKGEKVQTPKPNQPWRVMERRAIGSLQFPLKLQPWTGGRAGYHLQASGICSTVPKSHLDTHALFYVGTANFAYAAPRRHPVTGWCGGERGCRGTLCTAPSRSGCPLHRQRVAGIQAFVDNRNQPLRPLQSSK
ncbi:hypothetical protein BP6252_11601 [Coleophoma cylindrospora]|uniref:Uncharacterized protein n=1 Tax=Coleophoma cylindrospora TaxID=1849047 RepID=A0A3D8QKC0_9HELO|nr:hypothetical protein BP6252_11601 [Coleophoma cylindrospora]